MKLFVTWVIFQILGNGVGFRLALCQPPVSGLEVSSDTFGSLEPLIYLPERDTATTGPDPLPDSSVGELLREEIQALILIIPLWIIPLFTWI